MPVIVKQIKGGQYKFDCRLVETGDGPETYVRVFDPEGEHIDTIQEPMSAKTIIRGFIFDLVFGEE